MKPSLSAPWVSLQFRRAALFVGAVLVSTSSSDAAGAAYGHEVSTALGKQIIAQWDTRLDRNYDPNYEQRGMSHPSEGGFDPRFDHSADDNRFDQNFDRRYDTRRDAAPPRQ